MNPDPNPEPDPGPDHQGDGGKKPQTDGEDSGTIPWPKQCQWRTAPDPCPWLNKVLTNQPKQCLFGKNGNTGEWVRKNILYLNAQVSIMSEQWFGRHQALERQYPPGANNREKTAAFWRRNANFMYQEYSKYLLPIRHEIRVSNELIITYIHRLGMHRPHGHLPPNTWLGHINLQRRTSYLLLLCLDAMIDMRCLSYESTVSTAMETCWLNLQQDIPGVGTASGLNHMASFDKCNTRPFVAYASVMCSTIYPHGIHPGMSLKLPRHFLTLILNLFGDEDVLAPVFRTLLARYALFLAHIVWNPMNYDRHFRDRWLDHKFIFDLPNARLPHPVKNHIQTALDSDLDIHNNHHHVPYTFVNGWADWNVTPTHAPAQGYVTSPRPEHSGELQMDGEPWNQPCAMNTFQTFINHDWENDIKYCPETRPPRRWWIHAM